MSEVCYIADISCLTENELFRDASRDELRVLLSILELGGRAVTYEKLSLMSLVSLARVKSAIALWCEAGIIHEVDGYAAVSDEFKSVDSEDKSVIIAKEIRDEGLKELIDECSALMDRPSLSTEEIKNITSLYTDLSLSPEYILALTAYLAERTGEGRRLSVKKLVNEAHKLSARGIDTLEELEMYIISKSKETKDEWEYRRVLGIWGRNLSDTERGYFNKWANELGYSSAIVSVAYDLSIINTQKTSLPYMDKVLTRLHNEGCRTVEECKSHIELHREKFREEYEGYQKSAKTQKTKTADTPKYSDFSSEDALMRALERSYGDSKDN